MPRVALLLALLAAAAHARALGNGFVFDDGWYLLDNPRAAGGLTVDGARWALTTFHGANWHPLAWLSHLADVSLFGLAPAGHHLTSVLLHAGSAALLFHLLRRLTGEAAPAAAAAALFAVHPLRVESVAWVAERKDVLCLLLCLATLLAWRRHLARPAPGRLAAALLLFAAALAAKPAAVALPPLLLVLDGWPLGRWRAARAAAGPGRAAARLLLEKAPFAALAAAAAALTLAAQEAGGAVGSLAAFPPGARVANALVSTTAYLGQTLWPAGLSAFYPHRGAALPAWQPAAALLFLAALTATALRGVRRRPWLAAGWLWFLVALLPTIGIVQAGWQARADRYTYLPSIGLAVAAAWGARSFAAARRVPRPLVAGATAVLVLALGGATWARTGDWRDEETLFGAALAADPENWLARNNVGRALLVRRRFAEAAGHLAQARRLAPENPLVRLNLGLALRGLGRARESEAELREAVALDPASFDARLELAKVLAATGRPAESRAQAEAAVALRPGSAEALLNLGVALHGEGRVGEALRRYEEAAALDPRMPEAAVNAGAALLALGRPAEALPWTERAVAAAPASAPAHVNRAMALERSGRAAEAAASYRRALALDPGSTKARAGLARLQAGGAAR